MSDADDQGPPGEPVVNPRKAVIRGNYVDLSGQPVIATQLDLGGDIIGGSIVALGWVARWIKAASGGTVTEVFLGDGYLTWDHGTTRHLMNPGQYVVWGGGHFTVLDADAFRPEYAPIDFEGQYGTEASPPGVADDEAAS